MLCRVKVRLPTAIYLYNFDTAQIPPFQYASQYVPQQVLKHFSLFDNISLTSECIRHLKGSKPGYQTRIKVFFAQVFALVSDQPIVYRN